MIKIVAYASSTRPNHLWSAAQFDNAAPKNRSDADIPLVAGAEANDFKAKAIARGKLLERFRCHVQEVVDHAADEGDRVYFGTSNHFEYLKEIVVEMDMWNWDAIMRERSEVDPYSELRKVRSEISALTEERDRLREENERLKAAAARYMLAVKRLSEESGYNRLTYFEAPISKMPTAEMASEAGRRWIELNDSGRALTAVCAALSPTPDRSAK